MVDQWPKDSDVAKIVTDEDRAALRSEFAAFHRGLHAAARMLRIRTPLVVGSIAAVDELIDFCCTVKAVTPERCPSCNITMAEFVSTKRTVCHMGGCPFGGDV